MVVCARQDQRDGLRRCVCAGVVGNAADKAYVVGPGTVVDVCRVVVGCHHAVAEIPEGALAALAAAEGVDAVGRYGGGVVEGDVELAVAHLHGVVESGQRVACAGIGRYGETAVGIVHERAFAVIGHGVGGYLDALCGRDGVCRVCRRVPSVGKACRGVEGVAVDIAAEL